MRSPSWPVTSSMLEQTQMFSSRFTAQTEIRENGLSRRNSGICLNATKQTSSSWKSWTLVCSDSHEKYALSSFFKPVLATKRDEGCVLVSFRWLVKGVDRTRQHGLRCRLVLGARWGDEPGVGQDVDVPVREMAGPEQRRRGYIQRTVPTRLRNSTMVISCATLHAQKKKIV